ncbi:MAG: D-beta-D-heptose 7-phosphate kinase [Candidatus Aminicenantes bacterium]|nr:D-beta-D-heptose 7-phosphate kinase [Candidatus Aminicenantes bacterium]
MTSELSRLQGIIDRFSRKKIAVWGDFILDEYLYGKTRRISREAPVLIISYQSQEFSLGGAGNAVLNLKALGADPLPIGVLGRDDAGDHICEILKARGIPTRSLLRLADYQTPVKTRILAGEENTKKQQILRIDKEAAVPETPRLRGRLVRMLQSVSTTVQALLISDYNYQTVQEEIFGAALPAFKTAGRPVTLDSRYRLLHFQGITAATPNEPEVEGALHVELNDNLLILKRAGDLLLKNLQSPALLITRGSRGMALFEKGKQPFLIPIHGPKDIVDVTGAGDTVISVFTLALAAGAGFREATTLANHAGGIVVMKKGTATVSAAELKESLSG